MSLIATPSIAIKVPVHAGKSRAAPPVAARLQARSFPARHGASPEVRRVLALTTTRRTRAARHRLLSSVPPNRDVLHLDAVRGYCRRKPRAFPETGAHRAPARSMSVPASTDNAANNDTSRAFSHTGNRTQRAPRRVAQGARQRQRGRAQRPRRGCSRRDRARRVPGHHVQALVYRPQA